MLIQKPSSVNRLHCIDIKKTVSTYNHFSNRDNKLMKSCCNCNCNCPFFCGGRCLCLALWCLRWPALFLLSIKYMYTCMHTQIHAYIHTLISFLPSPIHQSYKPSCSHTSTRKSTISCHFHFTNKCRDR